MPFTSMVALALLLVGIVSCQLPAIQSGEDRSLSLNISGTGLLGTGSSSSRALVRDNASLVVTITQSNGAVVASMPLSITEDASGKLSASTEVDNIPLGITLYFSAILADSSGEAVLGATGNATLNSSDSSPEVNMVLAPNPNYSGLKAVSGTEQALTIPAKSTAILVYQVPEGFGSREFRLNWSSASVLTAQGVDYRGSVLGSNSDSPNYVHCALSGDVASSGKPLYFFLYNGNDQDLEVSAASAGIYSWYLAFDSQGGSTVPTQAVLWNTPPTVPNAPSRASYTFTGWYADAECTTLYDFSQLLTQDITVYAGWAFSGEAGASITIINPDDGSSNTLSSSSGSYVVTRGNSITVTLNGSGIDSWLWDIYTATTGTIPVLTDEGNGSCTIETDAQTSLGSYRVSVEYTIGTVPYSSSFTLKVQE